MKKGTLYLGRKGTIRVIKHDEVRGAKFSKCKKYRYRLWRIWDNTKPLAMVIGINPSKANETKDDPTIRNIRMMLTALGYGGFYMMNLFNYISTEPENLVGVEDPVGPRGDVEIFEVTERVADVIFAWGTADKVKRLKSMVLRRAEEFSYAFPEAKVFEFNRDASPAHPMSMMYKGLVKNPPKLQNYGRR